MLILCGDISEVFQSLCSVLCRRHALAEAIATRRRVASRMSSETLADLTLEEVVVLLLLSFVDCLNHDGSITVSEDVADLVKRDGSTRALAALGLSGTIEIYCRRAATVVNEFFRKLKDQDNFTLPVSPQWVTTAFGGYALSRTDEISDEGLDASGDLLVMMMQSNGPLEGDQLYKLEKCVIKEPTLLSIGGYGVPTELCTLLHQAVAGPAHELRLVEWLIQMDALYYQPKHLRFPRAPGLLEAAGLDEKSACNALAVHSAANAGHLGIVHLILEAEHYRDINAVTYHTRESLAHIAVRYGHRGLFVWLLEMGVDVRKPDASGKYVHELTKDAVWKRAIQLAAAHQQLDENNQQGFKNLEEKRLQDYLAAAEKHRQMLQRQRQSGGQGVHVSTQKEAKSAESTRTDPSKKSTTTDPSVPSPDNVFSVGKTTKTNNKKKKKNSKKPVPGEDGATATTLMEKLSVSPSAAETDPATAIDRIEQLSRALDTLLKGTGVPESEREASAAVALAIVDKLKQLVTTATIRDKDPSATEQLALECSRCLFLLSKYFRQLPEPPKRSRPTLPKTPDEDTGKLSSLEKLHRRAGTPSHFLDFQSFAIQTAHLLASCGRASQAAELLELVERRLLKCVEEFHSYAFSRFLDLVEGIGGPRHEELQGMVFIDNYVVAGAESQEKLNHKLNLIMVVAQISGVHFYPDRMHVGP